MNCGVVRPHSQGDFTLFFVDPEGQPLPAGALSAASVSLQRHDFLFGTAYDPYLVGGCEWVRGRHAEPWLEDLIALFIDASFRVRVCSLPASMQSCVWYM